MIVNDDVIFLPASEVREMAETAYNETLVRNRKELRDLIIKTAELGEFKVIWDKDLSDIIKTWLLEYGYAVEEEVVSKERKIWIVSWEETS